MLQYFLLVMLFGGVRSTDSGSPYCPDPGHYDSATNLCLTNYQYPSNRNTAYTTCADSGAGTLVIIKNALTNTLVANQSDEVWIGLTCNGNNASSCMWDDGTDFDEKSFNFDKFNASGGPCVFASKGKWYSSDCSVRRFSVCAFDIDFDPPTCPSSEFYFHGNCYGETISAMNYADQIKQCNKSGAEIISIHSEGENTFLTQSYIEFFLSIGLKISQGKQGWNDGTPFDYNNTGYIDNNWLGDCFLIALRNNSSRFVSKGQWVSTDCYSASYPAICKRPLPPSVISNEKCPSPFAFLTGKGNFTSPGYPKPSSKNSCTTIVAVKSQIGTYIMIKNAELDENTFLKIYNSQSDHSPVKIYTNTSVFYDWTDLTSNQPMVEFVTPGHNKGSNFYLAEFNPLG